MKYPVKHLILSSVAFLTLATSCGDDVVDPVNPDPPVVPQNIIDDPVSTFKLGNQIFSIPSPVETAVLIKETGANFDPSILNDMNNADHYATMFHKSVNLGVYGADLGYSTIYEDASSLKYLKSVKKLSKEVGVEGAFSENLITRFSNNISNQDTMLVLISEAYQSADNYLKENDKSDEASLILAGGWVESMYFSTIVSQGGSQKVIERIGDQKATLKSLIDLLHTIESSGEDFDEFVIGLEDLYEIFHGVSSTYEYVAPTTDPDQKLTILNSKNTVNIPAETLTAITEKVKEIRELITQ